MWHDSRSSFESLRGESDRVCSLTALLVRHRPADVRRQFNRINQCVPSSWCYIAYVVTCIDLDWQAATCATPNSAKDLICLSLQCRAIIRSHSGSDYAYSREAKVSAAWEKGGRVNFGDKFNGATLDTVRRYTPVEMGKPITQADRGRTDGRRRVKERPRPPAAVLCRRGHAGRTDHRQLEST